MQSRTSHTVARRVKSRQPDIALTKSNLPQPAAKQKKPAVRPKRRTSKKTTGPGSGQSSGSSSKKSNPLSNLLTPQSIQESLKSVGTLRKSVKSWLHYLQQADQMLETIYVTSNSLKETGVLDKLIKQRGKNLTTDDFTNILIALMNSPVGNQILKPGGTETNSETPVAQPAAQIEQNAH